MLSNTPEKRQSPFLFQKLSYTLDYNIETDISIKDILVQGFIKIQSQRRENREYLLSEVTFSGIVIIFTIIHFVESHLE